MAQRTEMERGFGYYGVFFFFTLFRHCTGYCSSFCFFLRFFFSLLHWFFFSLLALPCAYSFLLTLCCDWSIGHRDRHLGIARYDVGC
ncbi:hypothetical protein GGI42DRAFT_240331 [Trichoderma sp. SZMC 28013]